MVALSSRGCALSGWSTPLKRNARQAARAYGRTQPARLVRHSGNAGRVKLVMARDAGDRALWPVPRVPPMPGPIPLAGSFGEPFANARIRAAHPESGQKV